MVISASLQACGVVFPFAMPTSICRSIVTICSGLYLLMGMTCFSSKWILSHSTWYKVCRSGHGNPEHIRMEAHRIVEMIKGQSEQLNKNIDDYNGDLWEKVRYWFQRRRSELEEQKRVVAALGVP